MRLQLRDILWIGTWFCLETFKSITNLEKEEDDQFDVVGQVIACEDIDNYDKIRKVGKKPVTLIDDELFANQPSEQSKNTAMKISTASENSTNDTFVNKHPIRNIAELLDVEQGVQSIIVGTVIVIQEDQGWWYLGYRACHGKDETGTMSLSLFNDEVQAMVDRSAYQLCERYAKSESDGSIPTEITNLIGNKYAFNVAIDDNNIKKLLHVFIVLRFSNDQEIINSVIACATPIKDNEATSNTVSAISSLSQTDENTTPNEKQKTNKRLVEGEPRSRVSQMQQQDTNILTIPLPFGLNISLTLGNSIDNEIENRALAFSNSSGSSGRSNSKRPIDRDIMNKVKDVLGEQQVLYDENSDLEIVLHKPPVGHSMFEGWMEMNELYPAARELTYVEFPTKYVWNAPKRIWTLRKQRKSIGRIHNVPISTRDALYCRMLLNSAKGCRTHDEIKKVNGVVLLTKRLAMQRVF
nr:replication protein A 70 kDa DNA-binding subunit B [Tanacetum cinerariifolium]